MVIATPKDTRQILGLKGQNLVNFKFLLLEIDTELRKQIMILTP